MAQLAPDINAVDSAAAFLIDFNLADVPSAVGFEASPAAAAAMCGVSIEAFSAYTEALAAEVEAQARLLLADATIAEAVDAFPIKAGGTLLFAGDSITAYRRSYARLLEVMLRSRRPDDRISVINGARSGFTSSHGFEFTYVKLLGMNPHLVTVGYGGNDCKRFGPGNGERGQLLVGPQTYRANLAAIVDAFRRYTEARVVVLGPAPVIPSLIASNPDFVACRVHWETADLLACSDIAREVAEARGLPFVDTMQALGREPDPGLYLADGLHPNPAGQTVMLKALLRAISPTRT